MNMELDYTIRYCNDIDVILNPNIPFINTNKQIKYANVPCTLDIEVSSFYENGEKRAIMYSFVIGINGKCIIGRTYDELLNALNRISEFYYLDTEKRMIFFVHNLTYEFQFIRLWMEWEKVFAIEERKILYALNDFGIEFRCSYMLSGYSLDYIGKNLLHTYNVRKLSGALDYTKIRHSKTPLTQEELNYQLNDGLVVMAYIQEQINNHHDNISYLPLTKTGEVRNFIRRETIYNGSHHKSNNISKYYRRLISSIKITSVEEYIQLKNAFHGGFTHANANYVDTVINDVTSFDFSSSYPSVLVCEKYPMGNGQIVKVTKRKELEEYLKYYCCVFDVQFTGIESSTYYEHPISSSKCRKLINGLVDNGRVVSADSLITTLTDPDFEVIKHFYTWKKMSVTNFRIYKRGYLPTAFVKALLELYAKKTTLKGVEGKEIEYMNSKENVNSAYGMCVTDICRDELEYQNVWEGNIDTNGGWIKKECDYQKAINKYNNSKRRFLCYQWGIFVTSYAQRNLFLGIKECKMDYIYSDTDSIKIIHAEKHMKFINWYNNRIIEKLENAMHYHGLSMELVMPKTKDGIIKTLGIWENDGIYKKFKTLGAKRYMVMTDKKVKYGSLQIPYSLTISGLSKLTAIPFLYNKYKDKIFDAFTDGMYIPREFTGKNIHTYLDYEQIGVVKDYNGVKCEYHELSSIHMEQAEYELSMSREFLDFILNVKEMLK